MGCFLPHRTPFCERYTLIRMSLPPGALICKVVNYSDKSLFACKVLFSSSHHNYTISEETFTLSLMENQILVRVHSLSDNWDIYCNVALQGYFLLLVVDIFKMHLVPHLRFDSFHITQISSLGSPTFGLCSAWRFGNHKYFCKNWYVLNTVLRVH